MLLNDFELKNDGQKDVLQFVKRNCFSNAILLSEMPLR